MPNGGGKIDWKGHSAADEVAFNSNADEYNELHDIRIYFWFFVGLSVFVRKLVNDPHTFSHSTYKVFGLFHAALKETIIWYFQKKWMDQS